MSYYGSKNYLLEAERGNIKGLTPKRRWGFNSAVGTSNVFVNTAGTQLLPITGDYIYLKSTSAYDDVADLGIRKVAISYIKNSDNSLVSNEVIEMNGTSATSNSAYQANRLLDIVPTETGDYSNSSSSLSQYGTITAYSNFGGAGTPWFGMPLIDGIGSAFPNNSSYIVPPGKTAIIYDFDVEVSGSNTVSIQVRARSNYTTFSAPYGVDSLLLGAYQMSGRQRYLDNVPSEKLAALTEITVVAKASASNTPVTVRYKILEFS